MSFLRHREIYPSDGGLTLSAKPPLIVWMSFRLAIPRRVALQHCPPPLHQPATFCYDPLRSSTKFRRTATCPSFLCLTRGAHPRLRPWFPWFSGSSRYETRDGDLNSRFPANLLYFASTGIVVTAPAGVARNPRALICVPAGVSNSTVPRLSPTAP